MNKILFPTDFSDSADNAFQYAKLFASETESEIQLFHVVDVPLMGRANKFQTREKTMTVNADRMRSYALKRCHDYTAKQNAEEISHRCIVMQGTVVKEIVDHCKNEEIDIVIMATRGETEHKLFWLGSIAAEIVKKVNCPVLIIPGDAKFQKIKKVVYATDLSHPENHAAKGVSKFAEMFKASLVLVHVDLSDENITEMRSRMISLKDSIDYHNTETKSIKGKNLIPALNDYIDNNEIDVLAMCTHTKSLYQRIFHKSLTTNMVFHTHVPLLVYREELHSIVFL